MFAISCLLIGYSQASDETAGQGAATSPGQVSEETAGVPDVLPTMVGPGCLLGGTTF